MAFVNSAAHSHLTAIQNPSSSSKRSCYKDSVTLQLKFQLPKPQNSFITNTPFSSTSEIKKSPRSIKTACVRPPDLAVVTRDTWDENVLNSDIPVLVEFWAAWCGPCRMVHREIEEIAKEYTGKIKCYMLKADEDIGIAEKYGIKVVPVVVLFRNGELCDSVTGTMPNYVYTTAIEKLLSS